MASTVATTAGTPGSERLVANLICALNCEAKTTKLLNRYSAPGVLVGKLKGYCDAYPDFLIHPLHMFSEGGKVVVHFLLDLDAGSSAAQVDADLELRLLEGIAVCAVENGVVSELWFEIDVFRQLLGIGALSGPAATPGSARLVPIIPVADHTVGRGANVTSARPAYASTDANRSVVQSYLAALRHKHVSLEPIQRSVAGTALLMEVLAYEATFPGYQVVPDDVIAAGDYVAVRYHTRQRHSREFLGMPATGLEYASTGIAIYRVADGRIVEHWQQANTWALVHAIQSGRPAWTPRRAQERRAPGDRRQVAHAS